MFQPPVAYGSLNVIREHRVQAGDRVTGMCYFRGNLYTIETKGPYDDREFRLAVYSVINQDTVTLLDTLDLAVEGAGRPHIDRQNGCVYIPCVSSGVCVVRYDGSRLVPVTTLRCVDDALSVAVVSTGTVYVSNLSNTTVKLVDVAQDRITAKLKLVGDISSGAHVAVLGDTLVVASKGALTFYHINCPTPIKAKVHSMDAWDEERRRPVWHLTTDHHSSFLMVYGRSNLVDVFDISGNLTHTISIPGNRESSTCTVVGGQLWVGCNNGDIIVMSPQ